MVECWTTDHYHLSTNIGVCISEGCRSDHLVYLVHKSGRKTLIVVIISQISQQFEADMILQTLRNADVLRLLGRIKQAASPEKVTS